MESLHIDIDSFAFILFICLCCMCTRLNSIFNWTFHGKYCVAFAPLIAIQLTHTHTDLKRISINLLAIDMDPIFCLVHHENTIGNYFNSWLRVIWFGLYEKDYILKNIQNEAECYYVETSNLIFTLCKLNFSLYVDICNVRILGKSCLCFV